MMSQVLSFPPYVAAAIVSLPFDIEDSIQTLTFFSGCFQVCIVPLSRPITLLSNLAAWVADRYRKRGIIIVFNCLTAIIGVSMMAFLDKPRNRYAGVFLGVAGANSNVPSILSYMHNNIVGQMKRSIASALLIGGGACGGIAAANIFRQQDAPQYL